MIISRGPARSVRKRGMAVVALSGALAIGLAGCGGGSSHKSVSAASGPPVTTEPPVTANVEIYSGSFFTWLPYLASKQGFFAKNGINSHIIPVTGGGAVAFAAMANGAADVAMGDLSLAGPLMDKGQNLTVISGAVNSNWKLIAPKDSSVPSGYPAGIAALKGKPVGVVALGTSSYHFLQELSKAAGLGADGVTYQALGGLPANFISAIEGNRVAAAMAGPDIAYYMLSTGRAKLVYDFSDSASLKQSGPLLASTADHPGGWLWARGDWIKEHPAAVKRFQLALAETDVWMHDPANLDQVVALLESDQNLPKYAEGAAAAEFLKNILPDETAGVSPADASAYQSFWNKTGVVAKTPALDTWYSPSTPADNAAVKALVAAAGPDALKAVPAK